MTLLRMLSKPVGWVVPGMELPNLSNSMYVARLRYIQSIHESSERRNPDTLVREFLPRMERWRSAWLGQQELSTLRAVPFYYYLVARTKYYDQIVNDAIAGGVRQIISIGCGSDTRAYRFDHLLRRHGVTVLECDQAAAIEAKRQKVKLWKRFDQIQFMPIDLNDGAWPDLERWLQQHESAKSLVLMEGVSPYIDTDSFKLFLRLLSSRLAPQSAFAYDFKILGSLDDFGRGERTHRPFRLSSVRREVSDFHEKLGFRLGHMELSSELCAKLPTSVAGKPAAPFEEDCLLQLEVVR